MKTSPPHAQKFKWVALLLAPFLLGLSPGQMVPELAGKNQNGESVSLAKFRGHYLLVYFYPADDTPGCTTEANGLRDQYDKIKKLGADVVGVSKQNSASHRKFRDKLKLPFDLLVDEDGSLGRALGIESMPIIGLSSRQSLLIDPNGKVLRFYDDVDPDKHAQEVIADIVKAKATEAKASRKN